MSVTRDGANSSKLMTQNSRLMTLENQTALITNSRDMLNRPIGIHRIIAKPTF